MEATNDCRHHWVLGEPSGERVVGRCKSCDAVRVYPAYGVDWEVPAERVDSATLAADDWYRESVSEVMRWSA